MYKQHMVFIEPQTKQRDTNLSVGAIVSPCDNPAMEYEVATIYVKLSLGVRLVSCLDNKQSIKVKWSVLQNSYMFSYGDFAEKMVKKERETFGRSGIIHKQNAKAIVRAANEGMLNRFAIKHIKNQDDRKPRGLNMRIEDMEHVDLDDDV